MGDSEKAFAEEAPEGGTANMRTDSGINHACLVALGLFCTAAAALCRSPIVGDFEAEELAATLDPRIRVAMAVASGTSVLLQLCSFLACNKPERLQLAVLPFTIGSISFVSSMVQISGVAPVFISSSGRLFFPARVATCLFTFSLLMYLLWLTGEFPVAMLMSSVFWMTLTVLGWVAMDQTTGFLQMAAIIFSVCAGLKVAFFASKVFETSLRNCDNAGDTFWALRNMYLITTISWLMFPAIWITSCMDYIDHGMEATLWCLAEVSSTAFLSTGLFQGILANEADRHKVVLEETREQMLQEYKHLKEREKHGELQIENVSHELRTPLNGIIGVAESLMTDPETRHDSQQLAHCLKVIRDSGARLHMLVNNLLDNAALSLRELQLTFSPVKVHSSIDEALRLVDPLISSSVKVTVEVPKYLPPIKANRTRIVQVFFNIIGNSVKFCRKGEIKISAHSTKENMVIEFMDTGVGMTQEQVSEIFKPFKRGAYSRNATSDGQGLGVSLVKALVDTHSGSVTAYSELKKKTIVTVTLPLYTEGSETGDSQKSYNTGSEQDETEDIETENCTGDAMTALVGIDSMNDNQEFAPMEPDKIEILSVDDDNTNQLVLSSMLRHKNFRVIKALCGDEALKFLKQRHAAGGLSALPPVILMDVMMPGMDGYEATREIRRLFPSDHISVIMVSAKSNEESIALGFEAGANDYVTKPVKKLDLIARVERELEMIQARRVSAHTVPPGGRNLSQGAETETKHVTIVAVRLTNYVALSRELSKEDLTKILDTLSIEFEKYRILHNFSSLSQSGNLYIVATTAVNNAACSETAEEALKLASGLLAAASEAAPAAKLAITLHSSSTFIFKTPSNNEFFTGEALHQAALSTGFTGCICASRDICNLLSKSSMDAKFFPAPGDEESLFVLEDGDYKDVKEGMLVSTPDFHSRNRKALSLRHSMDSNPMPLVSDEVAEFLESLKKIRLCADDDTTSFLKAIDMEQHLQAVNNNGLSISLIASLSDDELQRMLGPASRPAERTKMQRAAFFSCMTG